MCLRFRLRAVVLACFAIASLGFAQTQPATAAQALNLIRISGNVSEDAALHSTTVQATFALYAAQDSTSPLWLESQTVRIDARGHYTALLGATSEQGVPVSLFTGSEARWLGITLEGHEQPRIQLVSVPYALKSRDADTLNGLSAAGIVAQAAAAAQSNAGNVEISSSAATAPSKISPYSTIAAGSSLATSFVDSNASQVVQVTQNGTGYAINATNNANAATLYAVNSATSGSNAVGILGQSNSSTGVGVRGIAASTGGINIGIWGISAGPGGTGILGEANDATSLNYGLRGKTLSSAGIGLQGQANSATGATTGVRATVASPTGTAMILDGVSGTKLLSARTAFVEKLSVDSSGNLVNAGNITSSGNVTAVNLSGNGSGLTHLDATKFENGMRVTIPTAGATPDVLGGYSGNLVISGAQGAVIGGGGYSGAENWVTDNYGFVGGGTGNIAGTNDGNTGTQTNAAIVGGTGNLASATNSFVGGGVSNSATASASAVGGGSSNTASGSSAFVGGGYTNTASSGFSSVGGGAGNSATNQYASVQGGATNLASGLFSSVPGGYSNTASGYGSMAAGVSAKAAYNYSFVWSDDSMVNFQGLLADNTFNVLSTGGLLFATHTTSGTADKYVQINANGTVTATGGFSGDGSSLTSVNASSIQSVPVSNYAPTNGQALRYDATASNWVPASFIDSRYYPVGSCNGYSNSLLWSGSGLSGTPTVCGAHGMAVKLVFGSPVIGPDIEIPEDWDGTTVSLSLLFYMDTTPSASQYVSLIGNFTCSTPGNSGVTSLSPATLLNTYSVTDTSLIRANVTTSLSGCAAGSILHAFVYRLDSSANGNMDMVGMTAKFKRKQ